LSTFIAHITNCLIIGNKLEEDGSSSIHLKLDNKEIKIIQKPEIASSISLMNDFQGRLVFTTKMLINNVENDEIESMRSLVHSVCYILSFLTCSQVVFYRQEFPKHPSVGAIVGKTNIYNSVIDIKNGKSVIDFIQSVWQKFIAYEKTRRLDMIIDYIHNANYPGSTVESKLVFSFVTLESLKYTFAESRKYPIIKGYFRKSDLKTPFSFIELLEQMFLEVGMVFNNKANIKDLRDEIIHSGLSRNDFNYNYKIFIHAQNLIREYLIKLLGYSNSFNKF
jgi:hypothetical protein